MEIIHLVLGKANPNRMNGVNKVVNSLATHQAKLGYSVHVWGIANSLTHNYPDRNYSTRLFQRNTFKFSAPKALYAAIKKIKEPTIFHLHGGFIPEFAQIARRLKKANILYLYTTHGSYNKVALERSKWKKKLYITLLEKKLIKAAAKVHFIGKSEQDYFSSKFPEVPTVLIPNGQNLSEVKQISPPEKDSQTLKIGFLGRLDMHTKGLDILLKGFADFVNQQNTKAELWLIGGGADKQKLEELVNRLQITQQVKFLGPQFGREKLQLLAQLDAFILNSRNEGLPGAPLEAAALKIPCIVSKATNLAEYIDAYYAGIVLKENTPAEIAEALQKTVSLKISGELPALGKNAYRMVEKAFDWSVIAKQLTEVYESCIQR